MSCAHTRAVLLRWDTGDLPDEVADHLDACGPCMASLDAAFPPVRIDVPRASEEVRHRLFPRRRSRPVVAFAVAAAVLLALVPGAPDGAEPMALAPPECPVVLELAPPECPV